MSASGASTLGHLRPEQRCPPPGPRGRALSAILARHEAPGINTYDAASPVPSAVHWQQARGANVVDVDGNRYLDLTSGFGVAAIGHRHPRVVAALKDQCDHLIHGLGDVAGHPARGHLAQALAGWVPVDEPQIYFAISGADAVEVAIKTALLATGRPGILAFDPSYHGLTLGALAATSRPWFRSPFQAHLHRHITRLPFACAPAKIAQTLAREPVGGILVEPIVGREGVLVPPDGWLRALADIAHEHGALLIADEIFTGFGRTGKRFAVDHDGVRPDLLCCGKALGGGLPIGAVVGRRDVMAAWSATGEARHTATFVAHPLASAAAVTTLAVLDDEGLVDRAARLGDHVAARLAGWPARFAAIRAVRGRGLLWGVELENAGDATALVDGARQRGVLLLAGGPEGLVAQLVPPLMIAEPLLDLALDLLESTLEEIDG